MDSTQTLHQALKEEVDFYGDDILYDYELINKIKKNHPLLILPNEVLMALNICIRESFVNIIHLNFCWNSLLFRLMESFADKYYIDKNTILCIGNAFAYALGLITEVHENYRLPKVVKITKPRRHRLDIEDIKQKICVEKPDCESLNIKLNDLFYEDGKLYIYISVQGQFTQDFKGGVFCVRLYDEDLDLLNGWHLKAVHSVPYTMSDKLIEGKIQMVLDPIYNTDNVRTIYLSFENAAEYDLENVVTNWISEQSSQTYYSY